MTELSTSRASTKVLIVDDHPLFAQTLEITLAREGYDARCLSLDGPGHLVARATAAAARLAPRIVLLDLDLGCHGDAAPLIHPLADSGANVVVVTASTDRARWGDCIRRGARTVLPKTRPLSEVLTVIRRISGGLPVLTVQEREGLLSEWQRERHLQLDVRTRFERLTRREGVVLGELMRGQVVSDIARTSFVSAATVRTQVKSILAKLEVSSQLAAVGLASRVGWTPAADLSRVSHHQTEPAARVV